ncbi:MAG: tetratricopeptide repeat protein [Thermoanaerobaculia bacterium]|nr:tetratricopeptide repeat protein [Thermoanaerobaculia bacterium]
MPIPFRRTLTFTALFATGLASGLWAAKKFPVSPGLYQGREPAEAAAALLDLARQQAGSGSWEVLAVARVHYLTGDKAAGQALIDEVLAGKKVAAGDIVRVARIYAEAGDWEKAKPHYDRVVEMKPDDQDWLAEAGAHYLVQGDRARAEELFAAAFAEDPESLRNTLRAAGAYLGLKPPA